VKADIDFAAGVQPGAGAADRVGDRLLPRERGRYASRNHTWARRHWEVTVHSVLRAVRRQLNFAAHKMVAPHTLIRERGGAPNTNYVSEYYGVSG
jgi:hypothetical protein